MSFQLLLQRCSKYSSLYIFKRSFSVISNFHSISNPHRLKPFTVSLNPVCLFWESFPFVRPLFYEKDGLSKEDFEIVYYARTFYYAFYGQLISLCALAGQFFGVSYYAFKSHFAHEVIAPISVSGLFTVHYDLITLFIVSLFTIQTVTIYKCSQIILLRVYYNEKQDYYVFITLGKNPFKSKLTQCKPGDLIPLKESMLSLILGTHILNDKRLFIRFDNFKSMYHYNNIIGNLLK